MKNFTKLAWCAAIVLATSASPSFAQQGIDAVLFGTLDLDIDFTSTKPASCPMAGPSCAPDPAERSS